jgi:putative SOS response-associated peptidase YedK
LSRPLAFFAGIWTPQHTSCRKVKDGVTCDDLYAFVTTKPNEEVKAIHPKAMPFILRTEEEVDLWLTEPWDVVKKRIKPLPDGSLKIVGRGRKKDGPGMPFDSSVVTELPPQGELF